MQPFDVYLSPHHDDVCFSLGARASLGQGGHLVNLYTISRSVAAPLRLPVDEALRIQTVTHLRDEEDRRFADQAGLVRHDLGLVDPPARGARPFAIEGIEADVEALRDPLFEVLAAIQVIEGRRPMRLFCPMGIGAHRNHLATLLSIYGNFERMAGTCRILLYEDLPYASNPARRRAGVTRTMKLFGGRMRRRIRLGLSESDFRLKMVQVGLYASQHADVPQAERFIPALPGPQRPHEAWWPLDLSTSPTRSAPASGP